MSKQLMDISTACTVIRLLEDLLKLHHVQFGLREIGMTRARQFKIIEIIAPFNDKLARGTDNKTEIETQQYNAAMNFEKLAQLGNILTDEQAVRFTDKFNELCNEFLNEARS